MSDERDDDVFAEVEACIRCAHCDLLVCGDDAVRCETCGLLVGPACAAGECPAESAPNDPAPASRAEP